MKIKTKLEDYLECPAEGCPADSFCECNSLTGKKQCVPYPRNTEIALKYYKKYLETDNETESMGYLAALTEMYFSYDEDLRCTSYEPIYLDKGSAYSMKPFGFVFFVILSLVSLLF